MARKAPLLFLTVLVIATAGLVYELLAGAIATTVLGNSLRQYSTTIGVYLFAMGVGSYLSAFIEDGVPRRFVDIEFATALIGGSQGLLLFMAYGQGALFSVLLYSTLLAIGILVGLEIPLLMRILKEDLAFKDLVARVLTFDYLGALLGSLVFSIVLVEMLMIPLERIGLLFGLLNCAVGLMSTWVLSDNLHPRVRTRLRIKGAFVAVLLCAGLAYSGRLRIVGEQQFYADRIAYLEQTPYQRIVVTAERDRLQLYLNGNLQFNSLDEYRYHEALVHPAMAATRRRKHVLVLGGGDGLAVREILRYPEVESVVLVDLDPGMTRIARTLAALRDLNGDALRDPRVHVVNDDAMVWLDRGGRGTFDVVIADFPDPNSFSLGKLYTRRFYELVRTVMHDDSALVVQTTSPLFARRSYWCIDHTLKAAGLYTRPFHVPIPSFGEWGYVLARRVPFPIPDRLAIGGLRFLNREVLTSLFTFAEDTRSVETDVNLLNHQVLVHYYADEWARVN